MTKQQSKKKTKTSRPPRFEQISVASLRRGRRGKHHDLLKEVLQDLETLRKGQAIKIPLAEIAGVTLANLRSAIHRATTSRRMRVETSSDEHNFYLWKL